MAESRTDTPSILTVIIGGIVPFVYSSSQTSDVLRWYKNLCATFQVIIMPII
jgi:hypothetical protein